MRRRERGKKEDRERVICERLRRRMDKRKSNVNEIWKKSIWGIHKISYNNLTIILASGVYL